MWDGNAQTTDVGHFFWANILETKETICNLIVGSFITIPCLGPINRTANPLTLFPSSPTQEINSLCPVIIKSCCGLWKESFSNINNAQLPNLTKAAARAGWKFFNKMSFHYNMLFIKAAIFYEDILVLTQISDACGFRLEAASGPNQNLELFNLQISKQF